MDIKGQDVRSLPSLAAGSGEVPFAVGAMEELVELGTVWLAHSHPTHELLWNVTGTCTVAVGDESHIITPQLGLWIPAGALHSGFTPEGTRYGAVQFNIEVAPRLADAAVAVEMDPLLRLLLRRLNDDCLREHSRRLTESMILDVLVPADSSLRVKTPSSPLLQPVVDALRSNPGNRLSLEQWAARLGVSTKTITRAFRAETGLGFSRWRSVVRAQQAVVMLAAGADTEEVAYRTGYHSASSFGAAFRRTTGHAPGRYRDPAAE